MMRFALFSLMLLTPYGFAAAADGSLYLFPERGTFERGQTFDVEVRADTDDVRITGAEAEIRFNPESLAIKSISTKGSVLTQWPTEPTFSNALGVLRFSGTSDAVSGTDVPLIRITFTTQSAQPGNVRIVSGALLSFDGQATNILSSMRSSVYTVVPTRTLAAASAPEENTDTPNPEVAGVTVSVPVLDEYPARLPAGDRIVIQGHATPDSTVTVYLRYEDAVPTESPVLTARDGSFTFVSSERVRSGEYTAWAVLEAGAEVMQSETITMHAESNGVAAVFEALSPLVASLVPFLLSLAAVGIALGFLVNKIAHRRKQS